MSARQAVEVAVGVLIRPDGRFLLASRPEGKPYAGYWEFPGGKLEAGETVAQALARELHEELGVAIGPSLPWVTLVHDYPHARVRLHFQRVLEWRGEFESREGQRFGFFSIDQRPDGPLLPATIPVLKWFGLPAVQTISAAGEMGVEAWLTAFDRGLAGDVKLVQLREPGWSDAELGALLDAVLPRAHAAGARVLVSSRHGESLWARADGVHLTARDLAACTARPAVQLVGASVHARDDIARAAQLACDFAVLGPVLPTPSHPGAVGLGWAGFESAASGAGLPVYALGGLRLADLTKAQAAGAHGVALRSAAWN